VNDGNEMTSPVTPGVRAADAFWPQDPALARALAAGVTTIQVLPGSANLIGGAGAILKLHPGRSVSEMEFPGAPPTLKMACGENPKRVYGGRQQVPMTRMGNVRGYRTAFQAAIEYGRTWRNWQIEHRDWERDRREHARAEEEPGESDDDPEDPGPAPLPPARNFDHEHLLGAIEGRVLIQMHCYRADEMVRMIEVGDELGFRVRSFHHAVEAYKIRDVLASREISISTWADWWGFKLEAYDAIEENLALLTQAGVRGVMHSDSADLVQRLNQEAAKAMTAGRRSGIEVSEDQALRWITANAAWTLGVDDRTGTLEPGKMADVVVWSHHPFTMRARAERVYIDGLLAFDRAAPRPSDFEVGQDLEIELSPPGGPR
jgi:imidazolonepropionase-like amidohydrolase